MKKMGEANRKKVLEAIPDDGREVSREDISEVIGLKDNAVKNHLRSLLADDLIRTNGKNGRAIRYLRASGIGREEMAPRPIDVNQDFTLT